MHGLIRWLVFTYLPSETDRSYFCDFNNCIKFSENGNNKILRTFGINQKYLSSKVCWKHWKAIFTLTLIPNARIFFVGDLGELPPL